MVRCTSRNVRSASCNTNYVQGKGGTDWDSGSMHGPREGQASTAVAYLHFRTKLLCSAFLDEVCRSLPDPEAKPAQQALLSAFFGCANTIICCLLAACVFHKCNDAHTRTCMPSMWHSPSLTTTTQRRNAVANAMLVIDILYNIRAFTLDLGQIQAQCAPCTHACTQIATPPGGGIQL